jgi:uncharacterized protein with HEPN domain
MKLRDYKLFLQDIYDAIAEIEFFTEDLSLEDFKLIGCE